MRAFAASTSHSRSSSEAASDGMRRRRIGSRANCCWRKTHRMPRKPTNPSVPRSKISRKQHAKSWELRATTSLARLLAQQGHRDTPRAMLAGIYNWFTEGFDTADLIDAKALLSELGG